MECLINPHYISRYHKFIAWCRNQNPDRNFQYAHRHHILPRCMGGGNEPENLIYLTPEQHFVAHWMLAKAYPNHKIGFAIVCMKKYLNGMANPKLYHLAVCNNAPKLSEEAKRKLSISHTGKKASEETRKILSEVQYGKRKHINQSKRGGFPKEAASKMAEKVSSLTREDVESIIEKLKEGYTAAEVSKITGIARYTIHNIKQGNCWTHVTGINHSTWQAFWLPYKDNKPLVPAPKGNSINPPKRITIPDDVILDILCDLWMDKQSSTVLSKKYNVSVSYINHIRAGMVRSRTTGLYSKEDWDKLYQ